jgi:1-deoxy-D-xylulose-5-phosphate reductoisomerase
MKRKIAILGSTGSIGTQALDVIRQFPENFEVEILTANNNVGLLVKQAREFMPATVVIGKEDQYSCVFDALDPLGIKVFTGAESVNQVVESENMDIVLVAMVGFSGLAPVIRAVERGKVIALATKEAMVVAGDLINRKAGNSGAVILPVDSEHSAIMQCLRGEQHSTVEKVYLTASGGPFRGSSPEFLAAVTKEQALRHPNWSMGSKITIDSASMMNKGLEAIEAKWLFKLGDDQIDVIIHPQSVVHSMVQFRDGSIKAQLGIPDMKLPILYALAFPLRLTSDLGRLDFSLTPSLTFEAPDWKKFRNLALAFEAMKQGGNIPCILNAANEMAVEAFLNDRIGFLEMSDVIENVMHTSFFVPDPGMAELIETDREARLFASEIINRRKR